MTARVLYFTDSTEFGGAENALFNLMAGLERNRWEKGLLYHPSPGISPFVENVRNLGVWTKAVPPMPLGARGAGRVFALARQIREYRPTFFHANLTWPLSSKYGLLAAALARVPVLIAVLHLYVEIPYSRSTRAQLQMLGRRINRYITVSQDMKIKVRRTFNLAEERVLVIHNGIPVDKYLQQEAGGLPKGVPALGKRPVILTASRLVEQKGLEVLLQAAAQLPEATFLLAGEGPLRVDLETMAYDLGIADRVSFLGFREDINQLLASCDLFVLPSLNEGLPLSILEAMAAGKAVVASRTGGTSEAVIHGETGWLVSPANPDSLAASIRNLLMDPQRARQFGEAGRERVLRRFTVDNMVSKYASQYESLLQTLGASRGT